jgi:hypothetical protein
MLKRLIAATDFLLLATIAHAANNVKLEWDYLQGPAIAGKFRVYQQLGCTGTYAWLADVTAIPTSTAMQTFNYTTPSLTGNATYCWQVTAVGTDGQESTASEPVSFRVPLAAPAPVAGKVRATFIP